MDLTQLNILALDCQATGANPGKGHLLEIGWITGCAGSASAPVNACPESYLIRLPAQTMIPPVVGRLTGISDTNMAGAVAGKTAWRRLKKRARVNARRNRTALCPTVIHFASFEMPFLRQLHAANESGASFPFHIICTHAIAKRLLPGLPRRGIRALAGYLGYRPPEFRRSADHAVATLNIWKGLVALLQTRFKIYSLEALTHWLATFQAPRCTKRTFPMDPSIRLALPDKPGVYRMRHADRQILYIGKTRSLKQRVNSYFRSHTAGQENILEMLSQVRDIDYLLTDSALEAALLEADEIKHHRPMYNIALQADRRRLVFCSRDLKQHASTCDDRFRIGPLPDGRLLHALKAFAIWWTEGPGLSDQDLVRISHTLLTPRSDLAPTIQCLKEGFKLFRSRYPRHVENRSALRIVTAVGAELRRMQLKTAAELEVDADLQTACEDGSTPENEDTGQAAVWTPEDIASAVESLLLHGADLIRRERWYCLLSESSLAWASAEKPHVLKHLVVFERGDIAYRAALPTAGKVPAPPGYGRPWPCRRRNFNLATYDRLRVATTELRRLVCMGRKIKLRLGPNVRLNASRLTQALRWV